MNSDESLTMGESFGIEKMYIIQKLVLHLNVIFTWE